MKNFKSVILLSLVLITILFSCKRNVIEPEIIYQDSIVYLRDTVYLPIDTVYVDRPSIYGLWDVWQISIDGNIEQCSKQQLYTNTNFYFDEDYNGSWDLCYQIIRIGENQSHIIIQYPLGRERLYTIQYDFNTNGLILTYSGVEMIEIWWLQKGL